MNLHHTDYLIIGAGILGLTCAYTIKKNHPDARVILLEKEASIGLHASGRNSGVLHSGIYYQEGTLKARLCATGAKRMRDFCEQHHLPCKRIGKVILPTQEQDDASLDVLYQRGQSNGVNVHIVDQQQLNTLEPEAKSISGRALYLPDTAVVDSKQVITTLLHLLTQQGVEIIYQSQLKKIDPNTSIVDIQTDRFYYKTLINTAGVHADTVARMSGLTHHYRMLPFRGVYAQIVGDIASRIRHLIYPVPNLAMPFLGVHTTTSVDGNVYLGPTAMPSFGRENYEGFQKINLHDSLFTLTQLFTMYQKNTQGMRHHVYAELKTLLSKQYLLERAQALLPGLHIENIHACHKRGIRAQLFDTEKQRLEMDFIIKKQENSIHVLNAISPAFTSSFAFVDYLFDRL